MYIVKSDIEQNVLTYLHNNNNCNIQYIIVCEKKIEILRFENMNRANLLIRIEYLSISLLMKYGRYNYISLF